MNPLQKALHQRAMEIVAMQRHVDGELLDILQRIDDKKVFRAMGHASLFDYAVKTLKLSEARASNFITVARKAKEVPQIKAEIVAGTVSVSTVRKLTPVIEPSNADSWLEKAKTMTKPQLEKEVAKVSPEVLTPERSRYVAEKRIALSLGVSEEVFEKLKRVKDLLSQKNRKAVSLEEALGEMVDLYLEKADPILKAKRSTERNATVSEAKRVPGHTIGSEAEKSSNKRPKIPAATRHAVILRDNAQCSFETGQGGRCEERRWLDFHHTVHRSQGGKDTVDNLKLLCFGHHRVVHGPR